MYLTGDLMVTLEIFHYLKCTDSYKIYIHLLEQLDLSNHPKCRRGGKKKENRKKDNIFAQLFLLINYTLWYVSHAFLTHIIPVS